MIRSLCNYHEISVRGRRLFWQAVVALLMAVLAVSVGSPAPAHAASTETRTIRATDHFSGTTVVASATVTITWSGRHTYNAQMCLKDERRDGWGVRFRFYYFYTDWTEHDTRVWSNDNGYGSTVCHSAWVNWPPDIYDITAEVWATGAPEGSGSTTFHNPYVPR